MTDSIKESLIQDDASTSVASVASVASSASSVTDPPARPPSSALLWSTLFVVQLVFVLWIYIAKFAMAKVDLPPLVLAAYREVFATISLLALVRFSGGSGTFKVLRDVRPHAPSFLLLGFLMFVGLVCYLVGLSMVRPFNAAILQPTQPIFASFFAWICRLESMSLMKALSIGMATSGAVMTIWLSVEPRRGGDPYGEGSASTTEALQQLSGEDNDGLNPPLGNALLLLQCICGGGYWIVQKRLLSDIRSPLVVTAVGYTIASCFTLLAALASRGVRDPTLYVTSPIAWVAIAYAALLATVFTYYASAWVNMWANPSTVTLSGSLQPLLTAIFTPLGGGPSLVLSQFLSCGLIIAGLAIKVYDQERSTTGDGDEEEDDDESIEIERLL